MQCESGRTRQNLLHSVRESKAKGDHIGRSFERPVPLLTELVLFFSANASPHWTLFGAPRKLGVSDWVQVPIE